jgi:eukaryotic-like serine/threonine-protein kinase
MFATTASPACFGIATHRGAVSTRPHDRSLRLDASESGWSGLHARGADAGSVRGAMGRSVPELPIGVREGEVLAEKYKIGETLGAGAMGVVVAARHLLLDQRVAIKFLVPRAQEHPASVARFMREARATARIKSEHVVRVLDVAVLDTGIPYIVMELLEGCDVAEWLRRRGPLPTDQACDFILQACDAVHEAHGLDIIHRDLKPSNLFVVHDEIGVQTIKVLDFGISKMTEIVPATIGPAEWKQRSVVTEDRATIGSPHYMSPEQMESARDVDARTDVWALGVTLYELVTGRLPFEGASFLQVYSSMAAETPRHLRASLTRVRPDLVEVILKCLERNRERRFGSLSDLAMALVAFGSSRAPTYVERMVRSVPRGVVSCGHPEDVTPNSSLRPVPEGGRTLASPRARVPEKAEGRAVWLSVALAFAAIVLLGLVLWASVSSGVPSVRSERPASVESAARASPRRPVATVEGTSAASSRTVVNAAPPAAPASAPAAFELAGAPGRARPAIRKPIDAAKSAGPPPSPPAPKAVPAVAPPSSLPSPGADSDWAPPDVPK